MGASQCAQGTNSTEACQRVIQSFICSPFPEDPSLRLALGGENTNKAWAPKELIEGEGSRRDPPRTLGSALGAANHTGCAADPQAHLFFLAKKEASQTLDM